MLRSLVSSSAKAPEEAEPFEVQAFFVRTKGAGNVESWPDVLTVRAVTSSTSTSEANAEDNASTENARVVEVNGGLVKLEHLKLYLRKDKPCCYVCTDTWKVYDKLTVELCDKADVWLQCTMTPPARPKKGEWTLECAIRDDADGGEGSPRWEIDVEVSLVGKCKSCPCFLSQTARTTRKIKTTLSKSSALSLSAINEDEQTAHVPERYMGLLPDFSEQFEATYKALGGQGSLSEGEGTGDITWFNAGLRIGVGVGLGICLGAGLGAGIIMRSYQAASGGIKRRFSTL